ncbi:SBBP repeat-containing protein, partial [bacterium]|nr:SBBP repeat-containing protein [bacterium]
RQVTLAIGDYDAGRALVIDPVLEYSSYLGGSDYDFGAGIAVDSAGNAYLAGATWSTDFPIRNALQPDKGRSDSDAFVAKLSADGATLVYATYLGGSSNQEHALGIAVDGAGNAYLTGETHSSDFPTRQAVQPDFGGGEDAFVAKLSADGAALVYATYLGGRNEDHGAGIAVDGAGNAYVTGTTTSPDFPTRDALQPDLRGYQDAFVSKFSADGAALVYASYLGGAGGENGIAVDGAGSAYLTGETQSADFPIRNALQPDFGGGYSDAFVAKLSADGAALVYSTYLGGSDSEYRAYIAVDSAGNAYLTGTTYSPDFPTRNALQPDLRGSPDAFVSKFSADGAALVYASYLGGNGLDNGAGIAVDGTGNAYVTGQTNSTDFPTRNALQLVTEGGDAFVAKFSVDGAALVYASYLGGSDLDSGTGIAVDGIGNAYVTGTTFSADFPTRQALQPDRGGPNDAFVTKIADLSTAPIAVPRGLVALGDLDGDGTQDLAVWFQDLAAGTLTALVRDAANGTLLQTIDFDPAYAPLDLVAVPDLDGNGAPELALLGQRATDHRVQVETFDALSGVRLSVIAFDPVFAPQRLAVVPGFDGAGGAALAVLGYNGTTGGIAVELKDARTGVRLGQVLFKKSVRPPVDFAAVADANGNGSKELAVLMFDTSTPRNQKKVELRDSRDGTLIKNLWSPLWTTPLGLVELPDVNGNGTPEIAVLGQANAAVVVKTADAGTAAALPIVFFNPTFVPQQLAALPDLDGNGVAELAVLGRANGLRKTELRDAATGDLVSNLWFGQLPPIDMAVIAVLGVTPADGIQVLIKDTVTQAVVSRLDF